jgi:hypothetical protein
MPKAEGRGKTLGEAFTNAAIDAIAKDKDNDDKWFDAKVTVQVTKNPGIKEYKVEIAR